MTHIRKKLLVALRGKTVNPPPIWLMRQAGRYLPEYRATRKRAKNFLDLCYNPDLATEVTLQPIRRFKFDGSILFSDILVVPHAMGRNLRFEDGRGPVMEQLSAKEIEAPDVDRFHHHLTPVYETVGRLKAELPAETTLIGFCGAPWTVATYMIAGHGTPDQASTRRFSYEHREEFEHLLDILADLSAGYLIRQIEAGADAVQIFDSWAGMLDADGFDRFAVKPIARMAGLVKKTYPNVPIIGFPRGAGVKFANYREETGVSVLGLDWTVPMSQARKLQTSGPVQGNLDPIRLLAGGESLTSGVEHILNELAGGPFVFNLGHGITPDTPISHVEALVDIVRNRST